MRGGGLFLDVGVEEDELCVAVEVVVVVHFSSFFLERERERCGVQWSGLLLGGVGLREGNI